MLVVLELRTTHCCAAFDHDGGHCLFLCNVRKMCYSIDSHKSKTLLGCKKNFSTLLLKKVKTLHEPSPSICIHY